MKTFTYTITDELGIHARPAGMLVKEAKKYESQIKVTANGKTADARKLMMLMSMGIKQNSEVVITAEGVDEDTAIEGMKTFFMENL